jgi:ribosomal-protein-alanine N-acetyltransferase
MLRRYRDSDLQAMVALDELCFGPEFRFDARAMRRFAEGRRAQTMIAEGEAGQIDGFVIVEITGRGTGRFGYCVTLDVAFAQRRCGLGGRLLHEAESWVRGQGVDQMNLHVWIENTGAIDFYERLGYVWQGVVRDFYGSAGMDALTYTKELVSENGVVG